MLPSSAASSGTATVFVLILTLTSVLACLAFVFMIRQRGLRRLDCTPPASVLLVFHFSLSSGEPASCLTLVSQLVQE